MTAPAEAAPVTAHLPDALLIEGRVVRGQALLVSNGRVVGVGPAPHDVARVRHPGQLLTPGLVNGHSHAFQRALRGRTEWRASGHARDDFWSWRERMYAVAQRLDPDSMREIARLAFLEMALTGITRVGEFHYVHHQPDGTPHDEPNALGHAVIGAAHDVGIRIALLDTGYGRSGFRTAENPRQRRFIDRSCEAWLARVESLHGELDGQHAWVGLAPHSVRAVEKGWLVEAAALARKRGWPLHMHLAEQTGELAQCVAEHGQTPVALVDSLGLLGPDFTAVHAIHLTEEERARLAASGSTVCACPTTERNLGDGVVDPGNAHVSLGSDSQAQIDLLEDARSLELDLRLVKRERAVWLRPEEHDQPDALARRLFDAATRGGARSIGGGEAAFVAGAPADFVGWALEDIALAGAGDAELLSHLVFAGGRSAVRTVVVGGRTVVADGRHPRQAEFIEDATRTLRRLERS